MTRRTTQLLLVGAGIACLTVAPAAQKGGKKPNTTTPVPLVVTVEDTTGISSDGLGNYEDGVDAVSASLDQYGNLIIDFGLRRLNYDYGTSPDPDPIGAAFDYLSTIGPPKIQEMSVGASECTKAAITRSSGASAQYQYWHYYGRNVGSINNSDTSSLYVERIADVDVAGEPKRSWLVQTPSACDPDVSFPAKVRVFKVNTRGKSVLEHYGDFTLPLKMTLVAK